MQKIWYWTKRIVIFVVSSLLVSRLTAYLFLAFISYYADEEDLKVLNNNKEQFGETLSSDAFLAFVIMYIVGFALLRNYKFKKTQFIVLSVISYLILFVILALFA